LAQGEDGGDVPGANYEIVVHGRLGGALTRWFEGVEVASSGPDATRLCGWFSDQAALQALLAELGALGIELSSVKRLPDPE
jgi:hypothetical protein